MCLHSLALSFCVWGFQILFEETLYQKGSNGKPLVDLLTDKGILLGIKVDKGVIELPDCDGETTTQVCLNIMLPSFCPGIIAESRWAKVCKNVSCQSSSPGRLCTSGLMPNPWWAC
jgi:fructose-bisphosphate aldolase class 1